MNLRWDYQRKSTLRRNLNEPFALIVAICGPSIPDRVTTYYDKVFEPRCGLLHIEKAAGLGHINELTINNGDSFSLVKELFHNAMLP